MDLVVVWFCVIALLWLGYLFLEGFDFGVGMLLPALARSDRERRVMINTIGPVWDGNEVWLIVAIGAMFAAFPDWYASLLSVSYLPLLLLLLALIGRGVAFEYRGKVDSRSWRRVWDIVIIAASWISALCVGAVLTTNVVGLPIDAAGDRVGGALALFRWETLLGALAVAGFSILHGAVFLALKTDGDVRRRARSLALRAGPVLVAPLLLVAGYVQVTQGSAVTWAVFAAMLVAAATAFVRLRAHREGQAFGAMAVVIAAAVVTMFAALYPNAIPSTLNDAFSLSAADAASSPYTLQVISWVALFGTPAVVVYQGWTYWVFRKRISAEHIP